VVGYAGRAFNYTMICRVSAIFTLVERADGEAVHPTKKGDWVAPVAFSFSGQ
jgi:hypothetical protein